MSGLRNEPLPGGSAMRTAGAPDGHADDGEGVLPGVDAAPHGYDPVEFGPGESRRDFPPRRERVVDEERRLLKEIQAAFDGSDKRHDVDDGPDVDAAGPQTDPDTGHLSRLYRD
jgi:hypothetical protein